MSESHRGSCLCNRVKFEIREFLPQATHCHCSMCRKFHGAAYASFASATLSNFRWLEGLDSHKSYTAENGTVRTFCNHCGSSLTFTSPKASGKRIAIALGTIDGDVPVTPNAHIYVRSAANWTVLTDDLPKHEEWRDSPEIT